ncbi:MAG: hypothetical protein GY730_04350 [bacterium]|nr:hypothetical protein [bacterium]
MQNTLTSPKSPNQKIAKFGINKILVSQNDKISQEDSLIFWMGQYFENIVDGSKEKTSFLSV